MGMDSTWHVNDSTNAWQLRLAHYLGHPLAADQCDGTRFIQLLHTCTVTAYTFPPPLPFLIRLPKLQMHPNMFCRGDCSRANM